MGTIKQRNDTLIYETLPIAASDALFKLDETLVDTDAYLGISYFWAHEYRHYLRDSTFASRRRVHQKLRAAGLETSGESDNHLAIIKLYSRIPKWKQ